MAYRETRVKICDITGAQSGDIDQTTGEEVAVETVEFGLDGVAHEIDLVAAEAVKLREALAPFAAAGRKQRRAAASAGPARGELTKQRRAHTEWLNRARAYLRDLDYDVSDRGRVPDNYLDLFRAYEKNQEQLASPDAPVEPPADQRIPAFSASAG